MQTNQGDDPWIIFLIIQDKCQNNPGEENQQTNQNASRGFARDGRDREWKGDDGYECHHPKEPQIPTVGIRKELTRHERGQSCRDYVQDQKCEKPWPTTVWMNKWTSE